MEKLDATEWEFVSALNRPEAIAYLTERLLDSTNTPEQHEKYKAWLGRRINMRLE